MGENRKTELPFIQEEKIKCFEKLCIQYGIKIEWERTKPDKDFLSNNRYSTNIFYMHLIHDISLPETDAISPSGSALQIAQLILFLRKVIKNNNNNQANGIKLQTTIKGVPISATLDNYYYLYYLELWANKMLSETSEGLYEYEFGWNFKEPIKHYSGKA
jgi:hypothetical protein